MKTIFQKIKALIVCGFPKKEGNYSRYFSNGSSWIFEAGIIRSILIDLFDKKGCWASHPMNDFLEKHRRNNGNSGRFRK